MRIEKDYEELLKLFNKHSVKYCIVGAFAVAFHAKPRYTKAIDIVVATDPQNAHGIIAALGEFGFKGLDLGPEDFTEEDKIIQLGYEPLRIDILTSIPTCNFDEIWTNKTEGKYGAEAVNFIGLDELIKNKRTSDRKQDQADLDLLLKVKSYRQSNKINHM